jgi:HD-GYP domain-containing protein (c-di-GMP phosphodiesterase class II)
LGVSYCPNRKEQENIRIYGRNTEITDVFDALVNKRCYERSMSVEEILNFFKEMSDGKFDLNLVELLLIIYH